MDREGTRRVEQTVMPGPDIALEVVSINVTPPDGRRYWLEREMLPQGRLGQIKPTFKIGEVARIFFARSPDWLRWLDGKKHEPSGGVFELEGKPLEVERTDAGARIYTLVDVERIAHALLEHRRIDPAQFVGAINIVRWMAYNYKILRAEEMVYARPNNHRPDFRQLPIEGIDEQIQEQRNLIEEPQHCGPCQRGEHNQCDLAAELAAKSWSGDSGSEAEVTCDCYLGSPGTHG